MICMVKQVMTDSLEQVGMIKFMRILVMITSMEA